MLRDFKRHNLLADKTQKKRGETRGDAAPEEQAMRAILLIPAAVAVILFLVYFVARRDDQEDDDRGILGVLIDLLSWW